MEKRRNLVGRDSDDGILMKLIGFLILLAIIVFIVVSIAIVLIVIGACFGGFFSIRNYILSFKENVIDSNRVSRAA